VLKKTLSFRQLVIGRGSTLVDGSNLEKIIILPGKFKDPCTFLAGGLAQDPYVGALI
jgi:hypothetical protein